MKIAGNDLLFVTAILVITYFSFCRGLCKPVIFIWDEAIYACNAVEMSSNHNYFQYFFNGHLSDYNVKPPLVIWLQAFCIRIFGISEFSLRLPSALAGIGVCLMLFYFIKKHVAVVPAFLSVILLATCFGFNRPHIIRSGDLDAVLLFFTTAFSLLWLDQLISNQFTSKKMLWFSLMLLGALFAKSVAGLIPLFGLIMGTLAMGKTRLLIKHILLMLLPSFSFLIYAGYYVYLEILSPGHFSIVWNSEFVRIVKDVMPWHQQSIYFYFENLFTNHYKFYCWLLLLIPFAFKKNMNPAYTFIILFTSAYVLFNLILLTIPPNKLESYDASVYPFLCIATAVAFYAFVSHYLKHKMLKLFAYISLAILIIFNCNDLYKKIEAYNIPSGALEEYGFKIRELINANPTLHTIIIKNTFQYEVHQSQIIFYKAIYAQRGIKIIVENKELNGHAEYEVK